MRTKRVSYSWVSGGRCKPPSGGSERSPGKFSILTYSIALKGLFRGPFSLIFNVTYRSIIKKNIKDKEAPTDESEPTVVAPTDESESMVAPTDGSRWVVAPTDESEPSVRPTDESGLTVAPTDESWTSHFFVLLVGFLNSSSNLFCHFSPDFVPLSMTKQSN